MQGNYVTLYVNEARAKLWKAHMSKIMNEQDEWVQIADADTVDGPIESDKRRDNGGVEIHEDWKGAWTNRGLCRNDSS